MQFETLTFVFNLKEEILILIQLFTNVHFRFYFQAQSETDSDEVLNSATEISTDSEFDQDPINHDPPKIYIDDSHLRRHPTRVHVKQTRTETRKNAENARAAHRNDQHVNLKFKPLIEVDPTIVRREPLKNPLPGNYLLSKTASTEGIASKKSLELKKRYLLGGETGNNAVLKSDSASALDIKLKSFASNISECQKLLNPASEISPSMQTFLQRIDRNNELNKSQHSFGISKELKDKYNNNSNKDQEEKENCSLDSNKKQEVTIETVNTTLIESKIREMSPEVPKLPEIEIIETIDLTTPEKKQPIVDLDTVEIPQNTIADNKQFIENMEKSSTIQEANYKIKTKLDSMFIDLTVDSPPKENHLNGTANKEHNNNTNTMFTSSTVPDIISNISSKINGSSNGEESIERPRSPAHETTIEVPQIWTKGTVVKEIDTDSLSNNSSTSSLEDIPHFILDSTTSPETQNENSNFPTQPPRLEVRDSSGELMQIDSLMIIDGQYIGDPEDLPLFEDQNKQSPDKMSDMLENSSMEPSLTSLTKPLKFDTKNENKLESLKHLPLIVAHEDIPKDSHVQLRFNDKVSPLQTPEDGDKTPLAGAPLNISDSENEITGQGLTETELSDWAADDAVSENFMDIEFALNSGKGTIKRTKKMKGFKSESERSKNKSPQKSKNESECGILKNLAIEEIDFMDTGSEAESIETHSASNRVVLKNHGYVKFVDHQHNGSINHKAYNAYEVENNKAKEKTPPPAVVEAINLEIVNVDFIEQGAYILNNNQDSHSNGSEQKTPVNEDDGGQSIDSLNASCDDIDEDSLIALEEKNQESLPTTTTVTTTETEDLTIVTSPLESLPKNIVEPSTPTNTTLSSTVITSASSPSDKYEELERGRFERNSAERSSKISREHIEEMGGYEEYVKSLQMKIAQISSGRESLEKKSRRKLSKSDLLGSTETPDDLTPIKSQENKSIYGTLVQVEAPQTLSKKLEELTKERTKQKDIIHDLVMNKLQAKKQLNAEKRLNRTKNRSIFMSNIQQPNSDQHSSANSSEQPQIKEQISIHHSNSNNVITYNDKSDTVYPINDSFKSQSAHSSPTKVMKTQSFCHYRPKSIERNVDDAENFRTPAPPPRSRLYSDLMTSADKMREDARARAKLKSNEDLGLSPEEKILLLRKRYNLMHTDNFDRGQQTPTSSLFANGRNQSDDMKYREKKLSVSKSFNDISRFNRFSRDFPIEPFQKPLTDCMSDPNLADPAIIDSTKDVSASPTKTTKSQRRDSDRRRSLIQTVSDFFHKKRDQSASNKDLTSTQSTASKDKLSENSSSTMSVFSRFRLSPKSKDSSKDKAKVCEKFS